MPAEQQSTEPTIGKPTSELPDSKWRETRHYAIWEATTALSNGEWLPVTFADAETARRFRESNDSNARGRGFRMALRGCVVYVGKKP